MQSNLFRRAKQLLDRKNGSAFTEEEWEVIGAAMIPLNHPSCPFPEDMPINQCLDELAKIVEDEDHV